MWRSISCFFCCAVSWLTVPTLPAEESARDRLERDWARQLELRYTDSTVSPEDDAAGAVDGVVDGKWGFHTAFQENPFWQLDLGSVRPIARFRLYNRCDYCGKRNRSLIASISEDGNRWEKIWQNDGKDFWGATDCKPLDVDLADRNLRARYFRLSLEGRNYLHLDEVEIYGPDGDRSDSENASENVPENIARGKKATQSSVSDWSRKHYTENHDSAAIPEKVFRHVLKSGRDLAGDLQSKGVDGAAFVAELDEIEKGPFDRTNYFRLRRAIRTFALGNPLIDFDSILFVKNAPSTFPHMSDQYYCFWQRGGGALCLLKDIKSDKPEVVELSAGWENGTFFRPSLSYDGKKVLFAYSRFDPALSDLKDKTNKADIAEDVFFHLYEMEIATGRSRKLTHGKYDDFDGRYLPNGEIVFLSTRKGKELQNGLLDVERMKQVDLPNSYVRCGGNDFRPVPVFSMHVIDADGAATGGAMRQISAFENFEWTPAILNDGRIAYTRWDYIDRFNGHFFSLWAANPDGTKAGLLYGNYTVRPQVVIEAAPIPDSSDLIFVASAHHSNFGGSLVLLDRNRGTEGDKPIERITPEVVFPETEGWPVHYYANPFPLSRDYYLVAWSDKRLPPHSRVADEASNPSNSLGIYYYDRFGNLELLYRDERISAMNPVALKSRPAPPVLASDLDWTGPQEGEFIVQNVYKGLEEHGFTADKFSNDGRRVRRLRIVGVVPKTQPYMNNPVLSVSEEDTGKFVLGTVPVEEDGSAYFRVPSGIPYFFQALDEHGFAVQTMRSLAYVLPNEKTTCIGCHEDRDSAPHPHGTIPQAARREPSLIKPDPSGSWPLAFSELIQPVLDAKCTPCHAPDSRESQASTLDLTADRAYQSLLTFGDGDLKKQAFERDRSIPGETVAAQSRLGKLLRDPGTIAAHRELRLTDRELYRFAVWMDTYAHRIGSFSDEQERELEVLRRKYEHLFNITSPQKVSSDTQYRVGDKMIRGGDQRNPRNHGI